MIHNLKTWPAMFQLVVDGTKTHEIRKADRFYSINDVLHLEEFDPTLMNDGFQLAPIGYSGRSCDVDVTFVTRGGEWYIPDGMVVMSIRKVATKASPVPGPRPSGMSMSTYLTILHSEPGKIVASAYGGGDTSIPVIEIDRGDHRSPLFSWDNSPMTEEAAKSYAQSRVHSIRGETVERA
jgi:hypothetical protein